MKLTDLDYTAVRLLSIEGCSIKAVIEDDVVFEFKFRSDAELSRELAAWFFFGNEGDRDRYRVGASHSWDFRTRSVDLCEGKDEPRQPED